MSNGVNRHSSLVDYRALRPLINIPASSQSNRPRTGHSLYNFTLMTYNILAQDHIKRASYPYCSKYALRWSRRRELLTDELTTYNSDIVCFQEMDRFHDYFQPLLCKLGYNMEYYIRNGPGSDVNCVGWKREKFKLIDCHQVSFEGTTSGLGSVPNVAQFVALEAIDNPQVKLIVGTTHLYWKEDCDHIRLAQMHAFMSSAMDFQKRLGPSFGFIILAGDLNSDPDSMALQAALRSNFMMEPMAFQTMLEQSQMSPKVLKKILSDFTINWPRIHDAYEDYASTVPGSNGYKLPFTTFCLYKGILDFILYTQCCDNEHLGELYLLPTALRLVPSRDVLEKEVALPNSVFPSDHLALESQFTIFHTHFPPPSPIINK